MNESGNSHSVKFSLSIKTENGSVGDKTIQELLAKIESLKNQIAAVQAEIKKRQEGVASCGSFDIDLYFGADFAFEITCLQEFLKNQGQEIYPEGLVTGNFLSLTRAAVVRFQEKHAKDILNPLGLQKGTGYAGALTRAKINQILSSY
jgi:peptidoglycan hydrolase-like protein with peptidoglycan-binding domain